MFEALFLPAITLAFSVALAPGPLQAYLISATLQYGWRRSRVLVLAPLISDPPIIVLVVFLLGQLPPWAVQGIRVFGGLLLLQIAWSTAQRIRSGQGFSDEDAQSADLPPPLRVLGTAVVVNFFSPGPYLFWATVLGPLLLNALAISAWVGAAWLVTFYGSFVLCMLILILLFDRLGQINERITAVVLWATVALLVWFGTSLIFEAAGLSGLHGWLTILALIVVMALLGLRFVRHRRAA